MGRIRINGKDVEIEGNVETVILGGTGPVNTGTGDQINTPVISGKGVTYVAGDNTGTVTQTFTKKRR